MNILMFGIGWFLLVLMTIGWGVKDNENRKEIVQRLIFIQSVTLPPLLILTILLFP